MFFSGIADEASPELDEQIRAHHQLGWSHIELRNVGEVNVTDLSDKAFEEVERKLSHAELTVSCFASQLCNWSRPITTHFDLDLAELRRAIPRMKRLGCRFIRTMSYPNAGWSTQAWRDEVLHRMARLAAVAEEEDIVLLHENCDGWAGQGPDETLELLNTIASDHLQLVWDTGNPVGRNQNPWSFYEAVREHIAYVHVKDALPKDESIRNTFPGEGSGHVRKVIADLLEHGYNGGFSIEPHMAAVIHEEVSASDSENAYDLYLQYGARFMKLMTDLQQRR